MQIKKIVSGGQTGVDRAALDMAIALQILQGGWCPKNRIAEDGFIAARYQLQETPSEEYSQRTEWNVRDSNGTLIIVKDEPMGGTFFTIECAQKLKKPIFIWNLNERAKRSLNKKFHAWINDNQIKILNIAGPRESQCAGIYEKTCTLLKNIF